LNLERKKLFRKTTAENGTTKDILYSLTAAVPAAIAQAKQFNLAECVGIGENTTPTEAGILTGNWIRENIKYKLDPFNEQNIQLPSSLLRTKNGDCKSLSLLFLSIMEAAGYSAGFRFAGYKHNKPFTHVYNYICTSKNNFFTFDCCIKDLKENQRYKTKKDMRVNYLAGTPVMMGEDINSMGKPTPRQLMNDDRYLDNVNYIGKGKFFKNLGDKIKKNVGGQVKFVKTVALAPARGSFLLLLDVNLRGLARKMAELRKKNPKILEEFWLKLGGKIDSLNKAIDKGAKKKAFLGEKKNKISGLYEPVYLGGANSICRVDDDDNVIGFDPATITAALASAAAIVAGVQKLMKKEGVKDKPEDGGAIDVSDAPSIAPPGEDFAANDPASKEAEEYALTGKKPPLSKSTTRPATGSSFKPSPVMIAGGIALIGGAIYLFTKKKTKK
jgi:LPXTG-motif cell wall-anchored protein